MICACIDIGSNTTRVLVAEVRDGQLLPLLQRRAFIRLGADLHAIGRLSREKIDEVAGVVAEYRVEAAQCGATVLRTVGTAAVRAAANRDELLEALRTRAGVELELIHGDQEARLAFRGATQTLGRRIDGVIGVVDVGGGSTEIAVGTQAGGPSWSASIRVGSGLLTDVHAPADPPSADELAVMLRSAQAALTDVEPPPVELAIAVGGSAASLRRLLGATLDPDGMRAALFELTAASASKVSRRLDIAPERVRLLPAGVLVLGAVSQRLGCPLELGCGGLREGICLDAAAPNG